MSTKVTHTYKHTHGTKLFTDTEKGDDLMQDTLDKKNFGKAGELPNGPDQAL